MTATAKLHPATKSIHISRPFAESIYNHRAFCSLLLQLLVRMGTPRCIALDRLNSCIIFRDGREKSLRLYILPGRQNDQCVNSAARTRGRESRQLTRNQKGIRRQVSERCRKEYTHTHTRARARIRFAAGARVREHTMK